MKKWYRSKTIWFNIVSTIIYGIETFAGTGFISPEVAVFILTIGNATLRIITKEAIELNHKEVG
jgi:hypothetical protein